MHGWIKKEIESIFVYSFKDKVLISSFDCFYFMFLFAIDQTD